MSTSYDLVVIGAGPGGYVAAIRAAQLGMKVACVEKHKTLGGTCLNVGCIPSKALLESSELYAQTQHKLSEHGIDCKAKLDFKKMMVRKELVVSQLTGGIAGLFKKNKIDTVVGVAKIISPQKVQVGNQTLETKRILIATGSVPVSIPGIEINQKEFVDSTGALALSSVPNRLIVIGGGYIGLELGSVYARLGSEVIVVEALDRIAAGMDGDISRNLHRMLEKQGMKFLVKTRLEKATLKKKGVVELELSADGKKSNLTADCVLVSVGRKPNTEGLGLDALGMRLDERGRIQVDGNFETSVPGIFAVGDVIAGAMLAHKASEEGVAAVEKMAGQKPHIDYNLIPGVIYTWPEAASVGQTEEQLKSAGIEYKAFKFPFLGNGRAIALGEKDGFIKLLADKKTDRILGAHLLGPRVSDLIAELVLAMEYKASAEDIARTVHAHPTLAEAVKEAALGLGTGAIHI